MGQKYRDTMKKCEVLLPSVPKEVYDQEKYYDHILAQYHTYIQSVEWVGELKQKTNSYFLTLNTLLLALIGMSIGNGGSIFSIELKSQALRTWVPLVGIVASILWWGMVYSYKQRNKMKLRIIHCLERMLPVAPHATESAIIWAAHGGVRYYMFSISLVIPWIFVLLYVLLEIFL